MEVDIAGATAELQGAWDNAESGTEPTYGYNQPSGETPTAAPTQETPTPTVAPEATDTFSGIDPASLPEELQPIYKSLQADYTRKLQEATPWRKLGEQLGVNDTSDIMAAWELHQTLQDPQNWQQLYQELGEHFGPQEAATQPVAPEFPDLGQLDPEEFGGPLKEYLTGLKSEFDGLKSSWEQERQAAEFERQRLAVMGEMTRQENAIRQSHSDYTDEDMDAIYQLSPSFQGNLLKAGERYEQIMQARLERYLASKQAPTGTAPIQGTGNLTTVPEELPLDLDQAHKLAMAALAELERAAN